MTYYFEYLTKNPQFGHGSLSASSNKQAIKAAKRKSPNNSLLAVYREYDDGRLVTIWEVDN